MIARYQLQVFESVSLTNPERINWRAEVLLPRIEQVNRNISSEHLFEMQPLPLNEGGKLYREACKKTKEEYLKKKKGIVVD